MSRLDAAWERDARSVMGTWVGARTWDAASAMAARPALPRHPRRTLNRVANIPDVQAVRFPVYRVDKHASRLP